MKQPQKSARAAPFDSSGSFGAILAALLGFSVLVYSSAAYGLTLAWHWLAAHVSQAQALGVALAITLSLRIYLSVRHIR